MKNLRIYLTLLAFVFLVACGGKENATESAEGITDENATAEQDITKIKLTDDLLQKYISTVKLLKEKGQDISNSTNSISALYQYNQLEGIAKDGGFKDMNQFIMVHTKVAWCMVGWQSEESMKDVDFDKMKNEGEKSLDEALKDPNLTAEAKKQLEQAKELLNSNFDQTKETTKQSLEQIKQYATEEDMALVKKYTDELKKIYESK